MLIWWLLVCVSTVCQDTALAATKLQDAMTVIHQWKYLDFEFASDQERQDAIQSGAYNLSTIVPLDVDYWNGIIFVTIIRATGVPSSLNTVSNNIGPGGPLLAPYPDWNWTNADNCSGITNVYRVAIDQCDRLWVLDAGLIDTTRVCPAQLLVFDLYTSTLLKRITIPNEIAINSTTGQGILVTPVIQTFDPSCFNTYVYIADARGHAIIIYDGSTFRRVTSRVFDYDPLALTFKILGQNFTLPDGPVGMALSPITRNLYFSPMASFNLDYVDSRELRYIPGNLVEYHEHRNIVTTQVIAKAISERGILFFGLANSTAIGCWNEFKELTRENMDLVAQNNVTLQVPSGMKIKRYNGEEILLTISNGFQKFATGTLNFTEVNFRILTGNVEDLISGTRC